MDKGDEMSVTLKSSSGAVLPTQIITCVNVSIRNPYEEAGLLTPTVGVKSIRFTYTKAGTAGCGT